ncbi:MAG: YggT family protein [Fimbriimonadales bacterium]
MGPIVDALILVIRVLVIIIFISVIFSWIRAFGGRVPRYNPVVRFIDRVSDALLDPIRQAQNRLLRSMGASHMPIDFSPLIAIILLQLLTGLLMGLR